MEKSKADAEFQVVKGYAVKGAIGIGVIAALMIVVTKIRTAMEEKAKQQKLAEERAAAAAEKAKPAEPTPADLKGIGCARLFSAFSNFRKSFKRKESREIEINAVLKI